MTDEIELHCTMCFSRLGRDRVVATALLVSALLVSSAAWSIVQAKASRSLVIRLRSPADSLLLNVRTAALAAGFTCDNHDPEPSPKTPLRCWLAGQKGGDPVGNQRG